MAKQLDPFGRTVDKYIEGRIQEARFDAVAFGSIVSFGKTGYELEGEELESFVRKVISSLIERGACVVQQATSTEKTDWELIPKYQVPDIHCLRIR
ncbi:MAG: hypothetical protein FJY56_15890 [Betaproteobacteria bacterium]|nr:hypothetical protein [Betaproteobacteria bacterium]